MAKISAKAVKDLQNAVRSYNSMRSKYINKTGAEWTAPKVNTQTMLEMAENTKQLREMIKSLKDFKKVADFQRDPSVTNINIAIGERRTFERLTKSAKQRYDKEIKTLMDKLPEASPEEQMQIIHSAQELRTKLPSIKGMRTRRGLSNIIRRLERERTKELKYGPSVVVDRDHFFAAINSISINPNDKMMIENIIKRVWAMTDEEWAAFCNAHPQAVDLEYWYDYSIPTSIKCSQMIFYLDLEGY